MDTKPRRRSNTKHASRSRSIQRRHFVCLTTAREIQRGVEGSGRGERERERERESDAKTQEREKETDRDKKDKKHNKPKKVGDPSNLKLSFKTVLGLKQIVNRVFLFFLNEKLFFFLKGKMNCMLFHKFSP
jgi:hypothetical protein